MKKIEIPTQQFKDQYLSYLRKLISVYEAAGDQFTAGILQVAAEKVEDIVPADRSQHSHAA